MLSETEETALEKSNAFINDDIDKILNSGYLNNYDKTQTAGGTSKSPFSQVSFELDDTDDNILNIDDDLFWEKALSQRSIETMTTKLKKCFMGDNLAMLKTDNKLLETTLGIIIVIIIIISIIIYIFINSKSLEIYQGC